MIGEPVIGRALSGRDALARELVAYGKKTSAKKRHIILAALRKCGRSSMAAAFGRKIAGRGTRVWMLDFDQRSPEAMIEHVIYSAALHLVPKRRGQKKETFQELLQRLPRKLDKVGPELQELWERWSGRMNEADLLERCLQLPAKIQKAAGGNLWVVVDNFDRLASVMGEDFIGGPFKNALGESRKVRWFLAGTPPSVMERLASDKGAFAGLAEVFSFHGLSYNESMKSLQKRVTARSLPPPYRAFLAALTGGHPFYLQVLGDALRLRKRELGRRSRPGKLVLDALTHELFAGAGRLNLYFDGLLAGAFNGWRAPELYMGMLEAIVRGHSSLAGISHFIRREAPALSRQVQNLLDSGLVNKDGTRYYIPDALLRLWLRHVFLARREAHAPGHSRVNAFQSYFTGLLDDFLKTTETETIRRVAGILEASDGKAALPGADEDEQAAPIPRFDQVELAQKVGELSFDLVARKDNEYWLFSVYETAPTSKKLTAFAADVAAARKAISAEQNIQPIVVAFGSPASAVVKASAKHKLTIWRRSDVNRLAECYGMLPIVG
ncbi:MAG: hypothetical protein QGF00_00600 [Planctomycetota bacterium]|jgi:hypothetical protein|nr:hypothetical protein [Planctomycetota bacterium]